MVIDTHEVTAFGLHPLAEGSGRPLDVKHACPTCPVPGSVVDGIVRQANPLCRFCLGTGLVDDQGLNAWNREQWATIPT